MRVDNLKVRVLESVTKVATNTKPAIIKEFNTPETLPLKESLHSAHARKESIF